MSRDAGIRVRSRRVPTGEPARDMDRAGKDAPLAVKVIGISPTVMYTGLLVSPSATQPQSWPSRTDYIRPTHDPHPSHHHRVAFHSSPPGLLQLLSLSCPRTSSKLSVGTSSTTHELRVSQAFAVYPCRGGCRCWCWPPMYPAPTYVEPEYLRHRLQSAASATTFSEPPPPRGCRPCRSRDSSASSASANTDSRHTCTTESLATDTLTASQLHEPSSRSLLDTVGMAGPSVMAAGV
jgi:hypothetical protein